MTCTNCIPKEGIEIPSFKLENKLHLIEIAKKSKLLLTKELMSKFGFSHLVSKYLTTHVNLKYGHCNRCNYTKLNSEYVNCPKCRALNINWNLLPPLRED